MSPRMAEWPLARLSACPAGMASRRGNVEMVVRGFVSLHSLTFLTRMPSDTAVSTPSVELTPPKDSFQRFRPTLSSIELRHDPLAKRRLQPLCPTGKHQRQRLPTPSWASR